MKGAVKIRMRTKTDRMMQQCYETAMMSMQGLLVEHEKSMTTSL